MAKIIAQMVAGIPHEFRLMDDDGDVLVCRRAYSDAWREAYPYFSVNFNDDDYSMEVLHDIADRLASTEYHS